MSDEYLWNRTGVPDPEIEHLESLLAQFRYVPRRRNPRVRVWAIASAIAAMLAIGTALSVSWRQTRSEWNVAGKLTAVGQTIETHGSGTTIRSDTVGEVLLDPNSRLEILKSSGDTRQLGLKRGTLHATIWAPPSSFVVQTPSASTIDLGCSYTLSVREDGSSFLTVETGWVAFQKDSLESFIPAGASCRTRPKLGPGLPYWNQSEAPFRDAVSKFDRSGGSEGLPEILRLATEKDALTLWHLIKRTKGADRETVLTRFKAFIPTANVEGLRTENPSAIDEAWNSLDLGATGMFRTYRQRWR